MFIHEAAEKLLQMGYKPEDTQSTGIYSFLKVDNSYGYLINIVNLPYNFDETSSLLNKLQMIKENIAGKYFYPINCLNVYVTVNPSSARELCVENGSIHWIADESNKTLIIYENQAYEFFGVRSILETSFMKQVNERKFIPYITAGLVVSNIIVFLYMYIICSEEVRNLIYSYGALYWPDVFSNGQYYRMISYLFLHADIRHVSNNMLLLFFAGAYVEEYMGKINYLILYFISGILAGVVSMGYNMLINNRVYGIGASGAIFGIMGALAGLLFLSKKTIKEITPVRFLFFVILSIGSGFENKGVDNIAHIGGLISGFIISIILILLSDRKKRGELCNRNEQ